MAEEERTRHKSYSGNEARARAARERRYRRTQEHGRASQGVPGGTAFGSYLQGYRILRRITNCGSMIVGET